MIKTLQRRFIAIAMCSLILVLFIIIGSINIINYENIKESADQKLQLIADNNGSFPIELFGKHITEDVPSNQNPAPDQREPAPDSNTQLFPNEKNPTRRLSAETPFDTRFFTVTLDDAGNVTDSNTDNIAAITASTAEDYASQLYASGHTSGFISCYRYMLYDSASGNSECTYIFIDCQRELNTFHTFLWSSIGISIAGLILVFLLVVFFARLILRPVSESYEKQKHFITNASHEIKTPLTIIDANTEVLEMEQGENEWTLSIHNQIHRLTELTNKLVFLSRMDEESTHLTMLDFSLSDAVEESAQPFEAVATSLQKQFSYSIEPNISYLGDEASIRQLISLLLDNAMKYSDDHGTIKLHLYMNGKNRMLTLWNSVPSITPGKQEILFERFYRADSSHNSGTGGHGIGLSAAKAIVVAHKGRITAKSEDNHSILFTITL